MYAIAILPFVICWQVLATNAASICTLGYLSDCMRPFQTYFDEGVSLFQTSENATATMICRKYETAHACISPALYRCPDLKKYMKEKLDSFDYACSHMDPRPGNWPFMPTLPPDTVDRDLNSMAETSDKDDLRSTAIKASVAAGVTVLLILVCVIAELVSRHRVMKRCSKATGVSASNQTETQALTKTEPEDDIKKI